MKKLLILFLAIPILFVSCSVEDGVDGIDGTNGTDGIDGVDGVDGIDGSNGTNGIDGEDGTDFIGQVFEVEIDFNAADNFESLVGFPSEIAVGINDIVVVFKFVEEVQLSAIAYEDTSQSSVPPLPTFIVWEPVPKTLYIDNEELLYGFDYSILGVNFYLDGTVNLNSLPADLTQNIIFRVVVLPANMVSSVDVNNLENVIGSMQNNEIIFLK